MVSLWYPATKTSGHALAPWLQSEAAAHYLEGLHAWLGSLNVPTTAGHLGAPVDPSAGKLPVLLYSTGLHSDRAMGTALVEDLASRGYLVVAIDHTHDASEVQFPSGRLETDTMPSNAHSSNTLAVRAADTHFVINQLAAIAAGKDPDVDHAPLPAGLARDVDMTRIGMFGWSLGGAAVATSMQLDSRIDAGADLDGQFFGPATSKNLNRPFLLFSSQNHNRNDDSSWATFWSHLHGQRYDLKLAGAQHLSFSDNEVMLPQAARVLGISPTQLRQEVGTIDPNRAISIQRTYLAAFFDQELRHQHSTLLEGPSARYPEISFVR
jgi:predicted dienelactone hydrolase